ncbi:MAG: hypothetical protein WBA76_17040 [Phormidesmis sp.]
MSVIHESVLPVIIGPGFHDQGLTDRFVRSLPSFVQPHIVEAFPADPIAVWRWLTRTFAAPTAANVANKERSADESAADNTATGLIAIGFSAGVVGLAGALTLWQQQDNQVARFFAIDGWGVPIMGLPVCRLSHDYFTHWSSLALGAGSVNFYADPPVDHLQMWGDAQQVNGRWVSDSNEELMTAADFLQQQLKLEWNKLCKDRYCC